MTDTSHAGGGVSGACPDLDTLADLHADVLDATTAAELRAHVDSCADCTATLAALDATVTSLGSMPAVQIPPAVAARIDSAIAAEAGRIDLTGGATPPGATAPGVSADRRLGTVPTDDRRLGGAPSDDRRLGSVPTSAAPTAPAANVASLDAHRQKRGLGRGRMLLVAAAALIVVGGGAVILGQTGNDASSNQADQQSTQSQAPSGTDERPDVQAFAAPKDVLETGAITDDQVSPAVAGEMAEKSARAQCLNQIVPRPAAAPEAVQQGTHDGKEAYAFVFPTKDPDVVEMIIVDANDCGTTLDTVTGPRE